MDITFSVIVGLIVLSFLVYMVLSIAQAISNSQKPIESIPAKVVAKRAHVSGGAGSAPSTTTYYATFEYQGGSREEIRVSGQQYSMLAEGDQGTLSRQGTWFKGFDRRIGARA
jgi:hypothetical protein